jgi:hypothetical protein
LIPITTNGIDVATFAMVSQTERSPGDKQKHHHPTTYTDNLWNPMNGYMTRKRNQLWIEANKTEMARYERASYKNYYKILVFSSWN